MTTSHHMRRLGMILIWTAAMGVWAVSQVSAGTNPDFRIVLHAKQSGFEPCNGYLPVNCLDIPPTVNVPSNTPLAVFVLLFNYTAASGIQTAFDFGGRTMTFALWDCGILLCDFAPCNYPYPGGPAAQILAGDFGNCVNGPALKVLGRMHFAPGSGCISQFVPNLPNGIHLRDCSGGVDLITDASSPRLGKICDGSGGVNACDGAVPVEPATWGRIKATY